MSDQFPIGAHQQQCPDPSYRDDIPNRTPMAGYFGPPSASTSDIFATVGSGTSSADSFGPNPVSSGVQLSDKTSKTISPQPPQGSLVSDPPVTSKHIRSTSTSYLFQSVGEQTSSSSGYFGPPSASTSDIFASVGPGASSADSFGPNPVSSGVQLSDKTSKTISPQPPQGSLVSDPPVTSKHIRSTSTSYLFQSVGEQTSTSSGGFFDSFSTSQDVCSNTPNNPVPPSDESFKTLPPSDQLFPSDQPLPPSDKSFPLDQPLLPCPSDKLFPSDQPFRTLPSHTDRSFPSDQPFRASNQLLTPSNQIDTISQGNVVPPPHAGGPHQSNITTSSQSTASLFGRATHHDDFFSFQPQSEGSHVPPLNHVPVSTQGAPSTSLLSTLPTEQFSSYQWQAQTSVGNDCTLSPGPKSLPVESSILPTNNRDCVSGLGNSSSVFSYDGVMQCKTGESSQSLSSLDKVTYNRQIHSNAGSSLSSPLSRPSSTADNHIRLAGYGEVFPPDFKQKTNADPDFSGVYSRQTHGGPLTNLDSDRDAGGSWEMTNNYTHPNSAPDRSNSIGMGVVNPTEMTPMNMPNPAGVSEMGVANPTGATRGISVVDVANPPEENKMGTADPTDTTASSSSSLNHSLCSLLDSQDDFISRSSPVRLLAPTPLIHGVYPPPPPASSLSLMDKVQLESRSPFSLLPPVPLKQVEGSSVIANPFGGICSSSSGSGGGSDVATTASATQEPLVMLPGNKGSEHCHFQSVGQVKLLDESSGETVVSAAGRNDCTFSVSPQVLPGSVDKGMEGESNTLTDKGSSEESLNSWEMVESAGDQGREGRGVDSSSYSPQLVARQDSGVTSDSQQEVLSHAQSQQISESLLASSIFEDTVLMNQGLRTSALPVNQEAADLPTYVYQGAATSCDPMYQGAVKPPTSCDSVNEGVVNTPVSMSDPRNPLNSLPKQSISYTASTWPSVITTPEGGDVSGQSLPVSGPPWQSPSSSVAPIQTDPSAYPEHPPPIITTATTASFNPTSSTHHLIATRPDNPSHLHSLSNASSLPPGYSAPSIAVPENLHPSPEQTSDTYSPGYTSTSVPPGSTSVPLGNISVPPGTTSVLQGNTSVPPGTTSVLPGIVSVPPGSTSVPLPAEYFTRSTQSPVILPRTETALDPPSSVLGVHALANTSSISNTTSPAIMTSIHHHVSTIPPSLQNPVEVEPEPVPYLTGGQVPEPVPGKGPEPVVYQASQVPSGPEPVVYQASQVPSGPEPVPGKVTSVPEPVVYQTSQVSSGPEPVVYQASQVSSGPESLVYQQVPSGPEPVVYQQVPSGPEPVVYQQVPSGPEPVVYQQVPSGPEPVVYQQVPSGPEPVVYQQVPSRPEPVVYQRTQFPPDRELSTAQLTGARHSATAQVGGDEQSSLRGEVDANRARLDLAVADQNAPLLSSPSPSKESVQPQALIHSVATPQEQFQASNIVSGGPTSMDNPPLLTSAINSKIPNIADSANHEVAYAVPFLPEIPNAISIHQDNPSLIMDSKAALLQVAETPIQSSPLFPEPTPPPPPPPNAATATTSELTTGKEKLTTAPSGSAFTTVKSSADGPHQPSPGPSQQSVEAAESVVKTDSESLNSELKPLYSDEASRPEGADDDHHHHYPYPSDGYDPPYSRDPYYRDSGQRPDYPDPMDPYHSRPHSRAQYGYPDQHNTPRPDYRDRHGYPPPPPPHPHYHHPPPPPPGRGGYDPYSQRYPPYSDPYHHPHPDPYPYDPYRYNRDVRSGPYYHGYPQDPRRDYPPQGGYPHPYNQAPHMGERDHYAYHSSAYSSESDRYQAQDLSYNQENQIRTQGAPVPEDPSIIYGGGEERNFEISRVGFDSPDNRIPSHPGMPPMDSTYIDHPNLPPPPSERPMHYPPQDLGRGYMPEEPGYYQDGHYGDDYPIDPSGGYDEMSGQAEPLPQWDPEPDTPITPPRGTPEIYSCPHVRVFFGFGGQIVTVLPNNVYASEPALVEISSLKDLLLLEDTESKAFVDSVQDSPGPFLPGQTPKSLVVNFASKRARQCRAAREELTTSEVSVLPGSATAEELCTDEILMWDFLVLLCQQNGVVVPSDIADLLMSDCPLSIKASSHIDAQSQQDSMDSLRQLLFSGRKKDALDFACTNSLWGHALMLASRMDEQSRTYVVNRFTASLMTTDPLNTFYTLLLGRSPSCVKPEGLSRAGDWRPHLSMILANKTTKLDNASILSLGQSLMTKKRLHASHICYYLSDVHFGSYGDTGTRYSLLGVDHTEMKAGTYPQPQDLYMMEVFEYAMSLTKHDFALPAFQVFKLLYVFKLVEYGFLKMALKYCEQISSTVVKRVHKYVPTFLISLAEIAVRLHFFIADYGIVESELPSWLAQLQQSTKDILSTDYTPNLLSPSPAFSSVSQTYSSSGMGVHSQPVIGIQQDATHLAVPQMPVMSGMKDDRASLSKDNNVRDEGVLFSTESYPNLAQDSDILTGVMSDTDFAASSQQLQQQYGVNSDNQVPMFGSNSQVEARANVQYGTPGNTDSQAISSEGPGVHQAEQQFQPYNDNPASQVPMFNPAKNFPSDGSSNLVNYPPLSQAMPSEHQPPFSQALPSEHQPPLSQAMPSEHQPPFSQALPSEHQPPLSQAMPSEHQPPFSQALPSEHLLIGSTQGNYSPFTHAEHQQVNSTVASAQDGGMYGIRGGGGGGGYYGGQGNSGKVLLHNVVVTTLYRMHILFCT